MMIAQIAWRNIWRNKWRSLVVIASVVIGMWAAAFIVSFSSGMTHQYVQTAIQNEVSHIQIHAPGYLNEPDLSGYIDQADSVLSVIRDLPEVRAAAARLLVNAMAATAGNATGVTIRGIDAGNENKVTGIGRQLKDGVYLSGSNRPVYIGSALSKKLHVKLRHKIVFTFQDAQGNMVSTAFSVTGIFKTTNSHFDGHNVFVRSSDLASLVNFSNKASEIAILLKKDEQVQEVQSRLQKMFPQLDVKNWKQLAPELALSVDSLNQFLYLFILIIVLALMFGIINTMLMAILERSHEIGMLMAIGMNRKKLLRMIMTETLFLAMAGTPIGLILAYFSIAITGNYGIDLSLFSEGLSAYGIGTTIYPQLKSYFYIIIFFFVFIATLLASLYPAIKALKMNPTEAMRTV